MFNYRRYCRNRVNWSISRFCEIEIYTTVHTTRRTTRNIYRWTHIGGHKYITCSLQSRAPTDDVLRHCRCTDHYELLSNRPFVQNEYIIYYTLSRCVNQFVSLLHGYANIDRLSLWSNMTKTTHRLYAAIINVYILWFFISSIAFPKWL